jgi:hypothetical protein
MRIKQNFKQYQAYNKQTHNHIYFNHETGGYIVVNKRHGHIEVQQNLIIAKILADLGEEIELLEDIPTIKSPDAKRNSDFWEFKTISKAKNVSRAIETAIRNAKKQAQNVLLFVNQKHRVFDVRYGIFLALKNNKLGNIKKIDILFENKTLISLKRSEITNYKLAQKFKGS